jgi:hypothetical protein
MLDQAKTAFLLGLKMPLFNKLLQMIVSCLRCIATLFKRLMQIHKHQLK